MELQRNVIEYLENSALMYPDKPAFADDSRSLTFMELKLMAQAMGSYVGSMTTKTNRPVAVLTERTVGSIAAFMGVLYSGNFYVPIDNKMPIKRIENILEQLEPELLLYEGPDQELAESLSQFCPSLVLDEGFKFPIQSDVLHRRMDVFWISTRLMLFLHRALQVRRKEL